MLRAHLKDQCHSLQVLCAATSGMTCLQGALVLQACPALDPEPPKQTKLTVGPVEIPVGRGKVAESSATTSGPCGLEG